MNDLVFIADINLIQTLIFIAGLLLVIIEMFYPGFGVPGITGVILLFIGIILTAKTPFQALILIIIILAILIIALYLVLKSAARGRLSESLILTHNENKKSGYIGTEVFDPYLGREGISVTVLRPSGTANFDGVRLDVVTEGSFVPPGTRVKVIKVEGRKIVVKPLD